MTAKFPLNVTRAAEALASVAPAADGSKLLAEHKTPKRGATCAGAVVLRHIPSSPDPYVTHWRNDDLGGHSWGHYFANLDTAVEDFNERAARGY